ncbi:MAG TPA: tetratricopeptide repeat protein, partial [Polyangiaceae bacterium]
MQSEQGEFERADQGYQRAVELLKGSVGLESQDGAQVLGNWASQCADRGDYARAEALGEQALAIAVRVLRPDQLELAYPLNNLGDTYKEQGKYARAEELYLRAYELWTKRLGADSALAGVALNNLGALYRARGDYARAQQLMTQALNVTEKAKGKSHPDTVTSLSNLAQLHVDRGEYAEAEALLQRALEVWRHAFGPNHPKVALALNNLGVLYANRGESARAEREFQQALAINQALANPINTARTLANLATLYDRRSDFVRAEPLFRQAVALLHSGMGARGPEIAVVQIGLASVRSARGDNREAEALVREACGLIAEAEGPATPDGARCDASLAHLLALDGKPQAAISLYERAIDTYRRAFGDDHPLLAQMLINLAIVHWSDHDEQRAVAAMQRGLDVRERHVTQAVSTGSEEQRRLFLEASTFETDWAVDLHENGFDTSDAAARLALLAVLRRKGRLLEVMSDTTRALRNHLGPEEQAQFDQLRALQSAIARRTLAGPRSLSDLTEFSQTLATLRARADEAERQIAARSAAFRQAAQPVTLAAVSHALRPGSALVEIVSHLSYEPRANGARAWGARRYSAYVLYADGHVAHADLGQVSQVDPLAVTFRKALGNERADARESGRALYEQVMAPLVPLLKGVEHLYVAPDGLLDLVPFGALVDAHNQYLIDNWSISYLSSGRELLRSWDELPRTAPLVVANPAFDAVSSRAGDATNT